jgi:hypothetical protein
MLSCYHHADTQVYARYTDGVRPSRVPHLHIHITHGPTQRQCCGPPGPRVTLFASHDKESEAPRDSRHKCMFPSKIKLAPPCMASVSVAGPADFMIPELPLPAPQDSRAFWSSSRLQPHRELYKAAPEHVIAHTQPLGSLVRWLLYLSY